jgi:DNA-binding protein YbaB
VSDLSSIIGDLDRLMESAQREAEQARDRQQGPGQTDASGMALDGKIKITVAADGKVSQLALADDVMRLSASELARELMTAFNAAWALSRANGDAAAAAAVAVDPAALAERMKAIREESVQSMQRITDSLADVMRKIDGRTK